MATLLRVDSSPRPDAVSRALTAQFVEHWQHAHPDGTVLRRDVVADPLPHVDADETGLLYRMGQFDGPKPSSVELAETLVDELKAADLLLIGSPMYNFTVTSGLKAWIDHVVWPGLTVNPAEQAGMLGHLHAVAVVTRSGGYGPGTPREEFNFQDDYLRKLLGLVGITEVEIVPCELTAFTGPDAWPSPPGGPDLAELGDRSRVDAEKRLLELAQHDGSSAPSPTAWGAPAATR